ncbi:hypothetical protein [Thiomicrorhabdus cannonii]|jgi:hypothetical protein|uniref:hypothetical protein n=1 Tax=Thiomicrorhabdus cannonii TaxID=2748011 RepID=UPI0015BA17BA|nr:hypothetical protein [Thiomicrorhabdus cannonii]
MQMQMTCEVINVSYGTFKPENGSAIDYASIEILQPVDPSESFAGKKAAKIKIDGNDKESAHQIAARIMADLAKHGSPMTMNLSGGQKLKTDQKTGKSDLIITVTGYKPAA